MNIKQNIKKVTTRLIKTFKNWGFSKRSLLTNTKGEWYLYSQILIILLHLIPPYPNAEYVIFPLNIFFLITGVLISSKGLIIALNAFIDLGDNLTPLPYPMKESVFVRKNTYSAVRHPLYKGLILISFGIFIFSLSIIHLALLICLVYILRKKALKEEELLKIKFDEYNEYIKSVPAVIKNIKYLDWRY